MIVREKKTAPRHKTIQGQPTPKVPAETFTFPAPINGWVISENLVTPKPASARILRNFICTTKGIRPRGGSTKYATLDDDVQSMWEYRSGGTSKLFAATPANIYDISAIGDADVTPSADVSGRDDGHYSTQQFGTAGGDYLYAVNDSTSDNPQLFDGSSWTEITGASSPAITGVTPADLSQVWSYANRLFFVEKDTLSAWYLAVDSIGGAASEFSLAGVFQRGGSLLFGARWSVDAGDGMDDKCVFVSTEGEVAVYSGTNPGSASDWGLQGLYRMPRPMGKAAHVASGGDLLIATEAGLIPLTAALSGSLDNIETSALSFAIAPHWQEEARTAATYQWQMAKIDRDGLLFISQPDAADGSALCVNLQTGAWSEITGWDTQSIVAFGGVGYFGSGDNCVYQFDVAGADDGTPYTCTYLGQHEAMGAYGRQKTVRQARPLFRVGSPIEPQVSALVDFSEELPAAPNSPADYSSPLWDAAEWDVDVWDASVSYSNSGRWVSVGATGSVVAPVLQMTFGTTPKPIAELVAIDVEYHAGAMVA